MPRDWKSFFLHDPSEWLVEDDNSAESLRAHTDLLDFAEDSAEVIEIRKSIMASPHIEKILSKQEADGHWGRAEEFYVKSKYNGTVWNLILLAQLEADGSDSHIEKACEFILNMSRHRDSGGFSYAGSEMKGGRGSGIIPCLTGNMLYALIKFGYLEDARVQQSLHFLAHYLRCDDGIKDYPKEWPYNREMCWGSHTCMNGTIKYLKALAEIGEDKRTPEIQDAISKCAEFVLKHHLFKRSHNLSLVSKERWVKFGWPRMWDTDAIEMLDILTKLGYRDVRMKEAVELMLSKQDGRGILVNENSFDGRFIISVNKKKRPCKMLTLMAARIMKRLLDGKEEIEWQESL